MHVQRPDEPREEERINVEDNSPQTSSNISNNEDTSFKPVVFLEFTGYFLLANWFGPLTYFLFLKFFRNGHILAQNLHIYGGWREIIRTLLWIAKIYSFVVTYTLGLQDEGGPNDGDTNKTYESRSQFWLVIYTDIALSVLHGAYYSSFTEYEIQRFKSEVHDPGADIVSRIKELVRNEKTQAFNKKMIMNRYPEIDVNNFYFIYPQKYSQFIPHELRSRLDGEIPSYLKNIFITNGIIIDGEKYADYLVTKGKYERVENEIYFIQVVSRVLVFIRVLLPVAQNIVNIFQGNEPYNAGDLAMYIIQQIIYSYFIWRFAEIYDILFIGLLLYYRRLKLLRLLRQIADVRPQSSSLELLKIVPTVPQNVENWLNLRKIFSGMNQQAFVVIDINTSFTLLYTILFVAFYALYSLNLLKDLLQPVGDFFTQNSILQAAIIFTIIVVVLVLLVHLVLGIMINLLFRSERKEWTLQSEIMRSIRISHNIYSEAKELPKIDELTDEYIERVENIRSLIGAENFKKSFETYIRRLRDSVLLVLDGLTYEETINPHTLLGIKTTPRLAVSIFTFMSAVGLSTVNDFLSHGTTTTII